MVPASHHVPSLLANQRMYLNLGPWPFVAMYQELRGIIWETQRLEAPPQAVALHCIAAHCRALQVPDLSLACIRVAPRENNSSDFKFGTRHKWDLPTVYIYIQTTLDFC
ncbi:hypothetical protein HRR83_000634 [Exophiala dermatitidis]|nr:hypothetical protein HRR74_000637 [Exophiala dermatitidis]KAJ4528516.1 hypothetical protein HRR73_001139 [Exophiala dermatitidis]KAJ4529886.1 hypothetical protein HRR76_009135 [Exophiala dermatitidis]KAJ4558646.1 hypothetical protein HRR77_000634 [Exophiala dermatitidis]KAJ4607418.1 hypothetical protein HRR84_000722 [Exophiala dermatitidis]